MTLADETKTIDNKIKANQAQYNLEREGKFSVPLKHLSNF